MTKLKDDLYSQLCLEVKFIVVKTVNYKLSLNYLSNHAVWSIQLMTWLGIWPLQFLAEGHDLEVEGETLTGEVWQLLLLSIKNFKRKPWSVKQLHPHLTGKSVRKFFSFIKWFPLPHSLCWLEHFPSYRPASPWFYWWLPELSEFPSVWYWCQCQCKSGPHS